MAEFISDTSTQTTSVFSQGNLYTSKTNPNLRLSTSSGIYYPSINNVRIYTNSIDALTIDSNQIIYGNGGGLTNLTYNNITGKPTNFQSDWTSTIINKPSTFPADMTNFYNKTEILALSTLTNYYNKTETLALSTLTNYYNKSSSDTLLNAKQPLLISSTNILGIGSNISLIDYNKIYNSPNLSLYTTNISLNSSNYISSNVLNNYLLPYDKITDRINDVSALSNMLYEIYDKYSLQENQYPAKAFDYESSNEVDTTFLGKSVKMDTFGLSNAVYGNGDYIVYSSSTYSTGYKKNLFNYNTVESPAGLIPSWGLNNFTAGIYSSKMVNTPERFWWSCNNGQ